MKHDTNDEPGVVECSCRECCEESLQTLFSAIESEFGLTGISVDKKVFKFTIRGLS